jgi:RNA 2',3'-cyclic 3'-phosphodiesterase
VRLFLAIDPGATCRRALAAQVDALRETSANVRWVKEDKLHVTLAFLGDVEESRLLSLTARFQALTRHPAFTVTAEGGGAFPDWRRARVIWFGLQDRGELQRLGNDATALSATLGFPSDHPFRAHLTVGRVSGSLTADERDRLRDRLSSVQAHHFDVTRVVLMRSQPGRGGSVYSELAAFPLVGP